VTEKKLTLIFVCSGAAWSPSWSAGNAFLAEFGSLHLEFEALAHHLNEPSYLEKVEKINDAMLAVDTSSWEGLFPSQYHPDTGRFTNGTYSVTPYYHIRQWSKSYLKTTPWNLI
jgi:hypothetical protein